jgi:hypothetical protein
LPPCFGTMFICRPAVSVSPKTTRRDHRHFLRAADVGGEVRRLVAARRVADVQPSTDRRDSTPRPPWMGRSRTPDRVGRCVLVMSPGPCKQVAVAAHHPACRAASLYQARSRASCSGRRRPGVSPARHCLSLDTTDAHISIDGDDRPVPLTSRTVTLDVAKLGQRKGHAVGACRRSSIRYRPEPSVDVVRTFSNSAGWRLHRHARQHCAGCICSRDRRRSLAPRPVTAREQAREH